MWAEGGVAPPEAEPGTVRVGAFGFEEAAMGSFASVVSFVVSVVVETAESVGAVEEGSVMFTSLATADRED